MARALDPHSEVVDARRRWTPEWYQFQQDTDETIRSVVGSAFFSTRVAAEAVTIPKEVIVVLTGAYYDDTPGGGALYYRVDVDSGIPGQFEDASGAFFILAPGQPLNVRMFGVRGDATDESAMFQDAILGVGMTNALIGVIGGKLWISGSYIATGLSIDSTTGPVSLEGDGIFSATIYGNEVDATILTIDNSITVRNIFFQGYGISGVDSTFGASNSTVVIADECIFSVIENCFIWGGKHALEILGSDNIFMGLDCGYCLGSSVVFSTNTANFFIRCKFDQIFPFNNTSWTSTVPVARANGTGYGTGTIVIFNNHYWQCMVAGTSGGSTPASHNYNVLVVDGTVQWQLVCPGPTYYSFQLDANCNENQLFQIDMTGAFTSCLALTNIGAGTVPQHTKLNQCIAGGSLNGAYDLIAGDDISISDCEMGAGVSTTAGFGIKVGSGFGGSVSVSGTRVFGVSKYGFRMEGGVSVIVSASRFHGTFDIGASFAANVSDFSFCNNSVQGTTNGIQIAAGTSDRYNVFGNIMNGSTATDGAAGANSFFGLNF